MNYKVYTKKYDEVVRPLDLADESELLEIAKKFHQLCPVEDFEPLKERLASLKVPDLSTVVTLLVDNSGSMRGWPVSFAVGATGIISMYLDRLGIRNEILGFTTKAWKGGQPREDWMMSGRPFDPGRLNALRHIVYKEVTERLEDNRHYLALMMKEGILKENIDGEAVEWASERLRVHDAEQRILLVISDGAPMDDATLEQMDRDHESQNARDPDNYLALHLKSVLADIRAKGDIKIDAIGIGFDVSVYYGVGDKIQHLEELAPVAITKLKQMLYGS